MYSTETQHDRRGPVRLMRLIGVCAIVLGALPLLYYLRIAAYIVNSPQVRQLTGERLAFLVTLMALSLALPVARVVSGMGLLGMRRWGRSVALGVFTIDYLLVLAGAISLDAHCYRFRYMPELFYNRIVDAGASNMWPSYIFACACLLFIALLNRGSVRMMLQQPGAPQP